MKVIQVNEDPCPVVRARGCASLGKCSKLHGKSFKALESAFGLALGLAQMSYRPRVLITNIGMTKSRNSPETFAAFIRPWLSRTLVSLNQDCEVRFSVKLPERVSRGYLWSIVVWLK